MSKPESDPIVQCDPRLTSLWRRVEENPAYAHSSVIVPSLSLDAEELSKISGVAFYEERLLFLLMRLRNPAARVLYVTSQPIPAEIIDYYLELLVGVPAAHARERFARRSGPFRRALHRRFRGALRRHLANEHRSGAHGRVVVRAALRRR